MGCRRRELAREARGSFRRAVSKDRRGDDAEAPRHAPLPQRVAALSLLVDRARIRRGVARVQVRDLSTMRAVQLGLGGDPGGFFETELDRVAGKRVMGTEETCERTE